MLAATRAAALTLVLAAAAGVEAGCSDAHVVSDAGVTADAAPDAALDDAALDAGAPSDAGRSDASRPPLPVPPVAPIPPEREPAVLATWLPSTGATDLASATPVMASPIAPDFGSCGAWSGGAAAPCEPWPSGRLTCSGAEEHFPGTAACALVGSACPVAGAWAGDVPGTGDVRYVRPGPTGAGTEASPYGSISEALAAVAGTRPTPVVLALSADTFSGPIVLPAGVTLWGACPSGTILRGTGSETVVTAGPATALVNLAATGGATGINVPSLAGLTLDRVLIEGMSGAGLAVSGGSATGTRVAIRNSTGGVANGALASSGGTIDLTHAVIHHISGSMGLGAHAIDAGSTVTLDDVSIHDTGSNAISLEPSTSFSATFLVIEDVPGAISGYVANSITLAHSVLRHLGGGAVGTVGVGVALTLDSTLVDGAAIGCAVSSNGPTTLRDVIVRNVTGTPGGNGICIWATAATLDRVRVANTAVSALSIWEGASLTVRSLDVSGTGLDTPTGLLGAGVYATDHATLDLRTSRIVNARGAGVVAGGCILARCPPGADPDRMGIGTMVTLTDVQIAGVPASSDGVAAGYGVLVTGAAHATASRVSVAGTGGAMIAVGHQSLGLPAFFSTFASPSAATIGDVVLHGGGGGGGIAVLDGTSLGGSRVVVAGARGTGVEVGGAGSSSTLGELVVADVVAAPAGAMGDALVARDSGALVVDHARVVRAAGLGAHTDTSGSLTLSDAALGPCGAGVRAEGGSHATLTRVGALDVSRTAFDATGAGTTLSLTDVSLSDAALASGVGLLVRRGAAVTANAVVLDVARAGAVSMADRETSLNAADLALGFAPAGTGGQLLTVTSGATAMVVRATLDDASALGVGAFGAGATISLTELRVSGTRLGACGAMDCASALGAYDGAMLSATRFVIDGSAGNGAQLGDDRSTLTLRTGLVRAAAIGAALPAGFDEAIVLHDTTFEGCAVNVSHLPGQIPVPVVP